VRPRSAAKVTAQTPRLLTRPRTAALLGVFAILLRATLFAEHHHRLPFYSPGTPAFLTAASATGNDAPGAAERDCQICFALGHHGAAPVDVAAALPSAHAALSLRELKAVVTPVASYLLFRSRAPPRA
jgi:hypothetical protein